MIATEAFHQLSRYYSGLMTEDFLKNNTCIGIFLYLSRRALHRNLLGIPRLRTTICGTQYRYMFPWVMLIGGYLPVVLSHFYILGGRVLPACTACTEVCLLHLYWIGACLGHYDIVNFQSDQVDHMNYTFCLPAHNTLSHVGIERTTLGAVRNKLNIVL